MSLAISQYVDDKLDQYHYKNITDRCFKLRNDIIQTYLMSNIDEPNRLSNVDKLRSKCERECNICPDCQSKKHFCTVREGREEIDVN